MCKLASEHIKEVKNMENEVVYTTSCPKCFADLLKGQLNKNK